MYTPSEARRRGMKPVIIPAPPQSHFIQNVMADMRRVAGTVWALVAAKGGLVEVWRVPVVNQCPTKQQ